MKKTVNGSGQFSKEARVAVVKFKTRKKMDYNILEICDHKNKIFESISKQIPLYHFKEIELVSYKKLKEDSFIEIKKYDKERIDLRYAILNKYSPNPMNEILHKTELDILDSWEKMKESLPEPFKTYVEDLEKEN